jgi:hypothetical protein
MTPLTLTNIVAVNEEGNTQLQNSLAASFVPVRLVGVGGGKGGEGFRLAAWPEVLKRALPRWEAHGCPRI